MMRLRLAVVLAETGVFDAVAVWEGAPGADDGFVVGVPGVEAGRWGLVFVELDLWGQGCLGK